jgi:hypothetical protein
MAINLRGVWSCMKFELQQMREQGSGAIVTALRLAVSSVATNVVRTMLQSMESLDSPRALLSNTQLVAFASTTYARA